MAGALRRERAVEVAHGPNIHGLRGIPLVLDDGRHVGELSEAQIALAVVTCAARPLPITGAQDEDRDCDAHAGRAKVHRFQRFGNQGIVRLVVEGQPGRSGEPPPQRQGHEWQGGHRPAGPEHHAYLGKAAPKGEHQTAENPANINTPENTSQNVIVKGSLSEDRRFVRRLRQDRSAHVVRQILGVPSRCLD